MTEKKKKKRVGLVCSLLLFYSMMKSKAKTPRVEAKLTQSYFLHILVAGLVILLSFTGKNGGILH